MIKHRHNIRSITTRTVNGRGVAKATITEQDGIFQAVVTDERGAEYASGSNSHSLAAERAVLADMLDPK
jgi:hypothetical protein